MQFLSCIKNSALYGGLDKDSYNRHKNSLMAEDLKNLSNYIAVVTLLFLVLTLVSTISFGYASTNTRIYTLGTLAMAVLFCIGKTRWIRNCKNYTCNAIQVYAFMIIIYCEATALAIQHVDLLAVTFICVLLVVPLLFSQRPIITILLQSVCVGAFCVIVNIYKLPPIAMADIWNAITFGVVSILLILFAIPVRIKNHVQTEMIREMSIKDMLTGLKNRNSYEMDCERLEKLDAKPICIYADVNGLHALNNCKGHDAGDEMLKTVARELKRYFGCNHTYRVGGDEFICFCFGLDSVRVEWSIDEIKKRLAEKGYHVSFGYSKPESQQDSLHIIIKGAETCMYKAKHDYYQMPGNDRRIRNQVISQEE